MSSSFQNFPYWLGQLPPNYKIQYGTASGTGANGNVAVSIPTAYSSTTAYIVLGTHTGTTAGANVAINNTSASGFTLYWNNAGPGAQTFNWMAIGN